jgi:zinc protease
MSQGKPSLSLPGPDDIIRRELSNGIVVLMRENHASPAVVLNAILRTGAIFETRANAGLASFTAAALMRGTRKRDFQTIYEEIESIGASLSIGGAMHSTHVHGKSLAEDLPVLLDVLADAVRNPTLPEDQVERLRGEITTGLQIRQQDTRQRAALLFKELAYPPEHPYSRSARGYLDTIPGLARGELAAFHRKHCGPRGMIVVVVGAVPAEQAIAQIEAAFGDWDNPDQPDPPPLPDLVPPRQVERQDVAIPDKTQSDIVLGVPGPARTAPDWWAARMANNILGVFGLMGRLGDVVRDKLGLAYYSFSLIEGGPGPGAWQVIAGVNPGNVERAIEGIVGEIEHITSEFVTEEELDENKSNLTGLLPLQLETNEGVAGVLLLMERYQLGLDYLQRYTEIVRAITRGDVLVAAQRYLDPQAYAVAVAGSAPNCA